MSVKIKKGGSARLIIEDFADQDYVTIPAGFRVTNIIVKKSGTTAGNLEVGTTDGGSEVVTSTALGVTDGALVPLTINGVTGLCAAETKMYLDVSVAAAAGDITFLIQKMF